MNKSVSMIAMALCSACAKYETADVGYGELPPYYGQPQPTVTEIAPQPVAVNPIPAAYPSYYWEQPVNSGYRYSVGNY